MNQFYLKRFFHKTGSQFFSWRVCLLSLILLFSSGQIFAQEDFVAIPDLKSQVTDLTQTLTRAEQNSLESMLRRYKKKKGSEIVLLILPTTKPETIETFSIRLADQWKIGRKKVDDGVILIVAKNDERLRIEVGYGLEGSLTDIMSDHIIREIITPSFKQDQFYEGIENGLGAIIGVIQGEELPVHQEKVLFSRGKNRGFIIFLLLFVLVGFLMRSWLGSGAAFIVNLILGAICGYLFLNLLSGIFMAIFGTLISSRSIGGGLGMMGMMGMGGGHHGGGGFGGGGGFSGGGGGFGGGGSSGGW